MANEKIAPFGFRFPAENQSDASRPKGSLWPLLVTLMGVFFWGPSKTGGFPSWGSFQTNQHRAPKKTSSYDLLTLHHGGLFGIWIHHHLALGWAVKETETHAPQEFWTSMQPDAKTVNPQTQPLLSGISLNNPESKLSHHQYLVPKW